MAKKSVPDGEPSDLDWLLGDLSRRLSPADYPDFDTGRIAREGWVLAPINMVVSLRTEKVDPKTRGALLFVGMDDIEPHGLKIVRTRPFSEMKSIGNRFNPGDLLYGRLRPYLNKTAIASFEGACSGELLVLAPCTAIESRYLQYFMHSRAYVGWVSAATSGDRPRVSFETAAQFAVPLAPLPEQRRIVARIDALFAEIAEGEAALLAARRGLETYRRALLKAAVTGELTADWREANKPAETGHDLLARIRAEHNPKARKQRRDQAEGLKDSAVRELPKDWAWTTIRELADVVGGLTKNPDREELPERAPYLRVANVQAGGLDLSEVKQIGVTAEDRQRASLEKDDLLVVEGNGSIDQIGRCALWKGEIAGCVHQNHIIKVRFWEPKLPHWCLSWLLSPHGRQEIERVAASTSGLHTLSISKIEVLPVPLPPSVEMSEILRRVSDALSAASDAQAVLDAEAADAARLRQSILKAAFEGRLVAQDPADEPAAAMLARLQGAEPTAARPTIRRRREPLAAS